MLAEFAQVHMGKLSIFGAPLFAVFAVGQLQQLAICGTVSFPYADLNDSKTLVIELFDADGKPYAVPTPMGDQAFKIEATMSAALPPMMPKGSGIVAPFSVMITLPIREGVFHFICRMGDDQRTQVKLPFTVLKPPPGVSHPGLRQNS